MTKNVERDQARFLYLANLQYSVSLTRPERIELALMSALETDYQKGLNNPRYLASPLQTQVEQRIKKLQAELNTWEEWTQANRGLCGAKL